MNRKNFIKNIVGASASLYATSAFSNAIISSPMKGVSVASGVTGVSKAQSPNIKRGVSSYCYQEELFTRQMSMEDYIAECSDIGAYGIELIPEQVIKDFPDVPDAWVDNWFKLMDRYSTKPICYTQFPNAWLYGERMLTVDEGVTKLKEEIRLAKKLGFKVMRVAIDKITEKCIPCAEENDIWLGIELHPPFSMKDPDLGLIFDIIEKTHTEHLGLLPDTGIFDSRPLGIQRDRQIRDGLLTKDIAFFIEEAWAEKEAKGKVEEKVRKMNPKPGDLNYIITVYNINPVDPRDLLPYMSKIKHIHGKFYDMTEDHQELTQDSAKIISVLKEGGYDGYISSEYEGQRYIQDICEPCGYEQVRRHHVMLKRLIG